MSIATLVNLQDDAVMASFEVLFPQGIPGASSADLQMISLRNQGAFAWPQRETGTYEIFYQGQKIVKTSVVEATDKKFVLQFRMDGDWKIFNAFNAWFKLCYDEFLGTADNEANTRAVMVIRELGANKELKKSAVFQGVKMYSMKLSDNNHQEGQPMTIDIGFIYYYSTFE